MAAVRCVLPQPLAAASWFMLYASAVLHSVHGILDDLSARQTLGLEAARLAADYSMLPQQRLYGDAGMLLYTSLPCTRRLRHVQCHVCSFGSYVK
jgi:hypothetical protein